MNISSHDSEAPTPPDDYSSQPSSAQFWWRAAVGKLGIGLLWPIFMLGSALFSDTPETDQSEKPFRNL